MKHTDVKLTEEQKFVYIEETKLAVLSTLAGYFASNSQSKRPSDLIESYFQTQQFLTNVFEVLHKRLGTAKYLPFLDDEED